jgi:hypothetical protein
MIDYRQILDGTGRGKVLAVPFSGHEQMIFEISLRDHPSLS